MGIEAFNSIPVESAFTTNGYNSAGKQTITDARMDRMYIAVQDIYNIIEKYPNEVDELLQIKFDEVMRIYKIIGERIDEIIKTKQEKK